MENYPMSKQLPWPVNVSSILNHPIDILSALTYHRSVNCHQHPPARLSCAKSCLTCHLEAGRIIIVVGFTVTCAESMSTCHPCLSPHIHVVAFVHHPPNRPNVGVMLFRTASSRTLGNRESSSTCVPAFTCHSSSISIHDIALARPASLNCH
ncbi:uncharacterized protein LACBIDRAFT_299693 [Laccaria bicolor S238N-H82]|uniref:Predicted protein n=1 Tax=Laccaria bicolor (strain S238N-H82 / ATCC MYA-4686) TaxID=486041 RepID=B0DF69_LACBS|nr:uncharacterized protein LACBIDRAFT_299693 [Laccaria bicolor S238N-H82]EDR06804.1 predicted protein [Laccaria bicolor S238N-H82]|eukprot:XP_001882651.1 predicted protein [Laccaria bicolor S238N-H82]